MDHIVVSAEISNFKRHGSGTFYFTLKDEKSALKCIMFPENAARVDFPARDGIQVLAEGSIRAYERDGIYQLYVTSLKEQGAGELYRIFEERKARLADMGMFAQEYKKDIPSYCMKLGVVTAATGAAIHDIINVATRRNPHILIKLYPALVQGAGAAASIAAGIEYLDKLGLDCIIVGRGGGSIEDLWAFNEEEVAMAVFQCETPIISAVGHEVDYTISDFVADLRAPTPSAAAELAVFDYASFRQELDAYEYTLNEMIRKVAKTNRQELERQTLKLKLLHPKIGLSQKKEQLNFLNANITHLIHQILLKKRQEFELSCRHLESLSPLSRLRGGYAFITDVMQEPVLSSEELSTGEDIIIHMGDGIVEAQTKSITKRTVGL